MKQSVTVRLAGHTLNLRTEGDPQHLRKIAAEFQDRIEQIRGGSRTASAHQVALLAGLQVCEELFQAQHDLDSVADRVRSRVERALDLLDEPEST